MKRQIVCLVTSMCFWFPAVSSAGQGDKTSFIDKYVYRIAYERVTKIDHSGTVSLARIYFAQLKNSKGKNSTIGNCILYLSQGNRYSNELIIKLAHTAYLEQKKVAVICEELYDKNLPASKKSGTVMKFTLKNL
jgi:hypothetical protein